MYGYLLFWAEVFFVHFMIIFCLGAVLAFFFLFFAACVVQGRGSLLLAAESSQFGNRKNILPPGTQIIEDNMCKKDVINMLFHFCTSNSLVVVINPPLKEP